MDTGFERVLTPEALEFLAELEHRFGPTRRQLLEARVEKRARLRDGEMLDFLPATREIREDDWQVAPAPPELRQRWVEITGPTDRKMVINALNSGRRRVHGRLRGRERADLAEHGHRPHQPARRDRGHDHLRRLRRSPLRARRAGRDAARPAARLAPPRAPRARRRGAGHRRPVRLRAVLLPLRAPAARERRRPVSVPAEDGVAPRGAAVERRVRFLGGGGRDRARLDQGDGPDRDAARRVRDGGDPVRAARALGRAERRPLGLHLLVDQVLRRPPGDGAARPRPT